MNIISNSLKSDTFPIIALADFERAVHKVRDSGEPLNIPIRILELRKPLPERLLTLIKDIFCRQRARPTRERWRPKNHQRTAVVDPLYDLVGLPSEVYVAQ